MNLRQVKFEDPIVDVAPLIDVVFLLLIFFMVTTTFDRESQIEVTLPEAAIDAPTDEKFTIERSSELFHPIPSAWEVM